MARPILPTKIKQLRGTIRKSRINTNEPIPKKEIGLPPACLNESQQAVWNEILSISCHGVLTIADRILLEIPARLLAEYRVSGKLSAGERGQLISCLSKMGLTPADRSKISVPQADKETNPFTKFG